MSVSMEFSEISLPVIIATIIVAFFIFYTIKSEGQVLQSVRKSLDCQNMPYTALNYSTIIVGLTVVVPILIAHSYVDSETFLFWGECFVGFVCTVSILIVVYYHVTTTPHPKFTMNPRRKFCIRTHVIAGTTEIFVSVAAIILSGIFDYNVSYLGQIQALSAVVNALAAAAQTPIVFGAKGIMIPGYYYVEILHVYFAYYTWCDPGSLQAILKTYYCVNIFTFVRVYIKLMFHHNIGTSTTYSVSSIMATVTMLPFLLGPASVFGFIFICCLNGEVVRSLMGVNVYHPDYLVLIHEYDRYKVFDEQVQSQWKGSNECTTPDLSPQHYRSGGDPWAASDRSKAMKMFNDMDIDDSGTIDYDEVVELLEKLRVSKPVVAMMTRLLEKKGGSFTFDDFYEKIWRMKSFQKPNRKASAASTDEEKARMIFDGIDVDHSGEIDISELAQLLCEWGCPDDEIEAYVQRFDKDHSGSFSFEEFFSTMKELWTFGFELMLLQESTDRQEGMQLVRKASKHDLTSHVDH